MLVIPNACEGPRKRLNAFDFSKSGGHGKVARKLGMTRLEAPICSALSLIRPPLFGTEHLIPSLAEFLIDFLFPFGSTKKPRGDRGFFVFADFSAGFKLVCEKGGLTSLFLRCI